MGSAITIPLNTAELFCPVLTASAFSGCKLMTIKGFTGSYAETYAAKNGIPFEPISALPQHPIGDISGDNALSVDDAQRILNYYVLNTLSDTPVSWNELFAA